MFLGPSSFNFFERYEFIPSISSSIIKLAISAFSSPEQMNKVFKNIPRCLQQAVLELSDLMARGVKI